jgi:hypothetical protein
VLAFTEWRQTPNPPIPAFLPQRYHQLFQQQSMIGWHHILHGRFSILWYDLQLQTHTQTNPLWLSYIIRTIWQLISKIWKHRCDTIHGTNLLDTRQQALQRLTPQVQAMFDQQGQIDPADKYIFERTSNEILQMPTHLIERWIFKTDKNIKESINQNRIQTQRTTHPIRQFLQRIIHRQGQIAQPRQPRPRLNVPQNQIAHRNLISRSITFFFQQN